MQLQIQMQMLQAMQINRKEIVRSLLGGYHDAGPYGDGIFRPLCKLEEKRVGWVEKCSPTASALMQCI